MDLIQIKNLVKIYDDNGLSTKAVDGISLNIKTGEYVAIMGPSGSGKSTLLQILGCLERHTSGEYSFDGKEISSYSDEELALMRNQSIGFVFQNFNLLPRLSVLENVKLPLVYSQMPAVQRAPMAKEMIKLVDLEDRMNYPTSKLSGGEKQRVAIARALTNNPKIIFADEPTGSLDSKAGEIILKFFEDMHSQGKTILLVTHESQVAQCAERVIHLKDGCIESDINNSDRRIVYKSGFIK